MTSQSLSSNLDGGGGPVDDSREAQRERRANAALTRIHNRAEHPFEEASSQETPSQSTAEDPTVVTQEQEAESSSQRRLSNEEVAVQLEFDDEGVLPTNQDNANSQGPPDPRGIPPYSEEERQLDEQVEEYRDPILLEFAVEDPVEFNGQIYERLSIETYLTRHGIDFSGPFTYTAPFDTVPDPVHRTPVPLNFESPRPYMEVNSRYTRTLRQEVAEYKARADRRKYYLDHR